MNNQRRAKLRKAVRNINKAKDLISGISESIEEVKMDEETMYDNLPDWKQTSEHGLAAEEACCDMQQAIDELEYADTNLDEAVGLLEGIANE